jgi:hypothetical protein
MGGGPQTPAMHSSGKKEVALVTLPMPPETVRKGIEGLEAEFPDIEVKFFDLRPVDGKVKEVPEGMHISQVPLVYLIPPSYRQRSVHVVHVLTLNLNLISYQQINTH